MAKITLIDFTGTYYSTYKLYASTVIYSGKKEVEIKPNANIGGPIEGQTLAYENPKIVVSGGYLTTNPDSITISELQQIYKHKYTGANKLFLKVDYGEEYYVETPVVDAAEYSTTATTYTLKATYSPNTTVSKIVMDTKKIGSAASYIKVRYDYSDASWAEHVSEILTTNYGVMVPASQKSFINIYPEKTVSTIKVYIQAGAAGTGYFKTATYSTTVVGVAKTIPSLDGTTGIGIPVLLTDFNMVFDAKDSKEAKLPTYSLTFVETK